MYTGVRNKRFIKISFNNMYEFNRVIALLGDAKCEFRLTTDFTKSLYIIECDITETFEDFLEEVYYIPALQYLTD